MTTPISFSARQNRRPGARPIFVVVIPRPSKGTQPPLPASAPPKPDRLTLSTPTDEHLPKKPSDPPGGEQRPAPKQVIPRDNGSGGSSDGQGGFVGTGEIADRTRTGFDGTAYD